MKSTLLVALAYLKRRRKQSFIIGVSILVSAVLMTTGVGVLVSINKPFDEMFDRLGASHILLYYDFRQNNADDIKEWFENQPEVEFVSQAQNFVSITEPMTYKSQKIDIMVRITELGNHQMDYDQLLIVDGDEKEGIVNGRVWIPRHLSVKYNIIPGDTLMIPLATGPYPIEVSGVVIDPHFVSGLINPNRIWVAQGELPYMVQLGELNQVMQGIRLKNKENINAIWARFNKAFNYSGTHMEYSLFKSVFASIYQIIGFIILIFSVLAIILSSYVISTIISSSVLADVQLTGTLKALGFIPGQITGIYLLQYMLLAMACIPLGLLCSLLSIKIILRSVLNSIGLLNFNLPLFDIFLLCGLLFFLLVFFLTWIFSRKAGKVLPALALKAETGDTNIKRTRIALPVKIELIPLSIWLAIRWILDNPRKSLLSLASFVLTAFLLGFSINIANSFSKIDENKTMWGFDNSDIQISRATGVILPLEHNRFVKEIKEDESVRGLVSYGFYEISIPGSHNSPPLDMGGKIYEGNPDVIGLLNIEGKHPQKSRDISLCVGSAKKLNKTIGDSIVVLIENEPVKFHLSGIYQDISNLGEGFRLDVSALEAVNPLFDPDRYAIVLVNESNAEEYKKSLLRRYGESIRIELTIEEQLAFLGVSKNINASMVLISIFFILVLIVSVFNDVFLNIWKNRKSIGAYKLIGFTAGQLQEIMILKTSLFVLIGTIIGFPLALLFAPGIMSIVTSQMGVVDFPLAVTFKGSFVVYVILLTAAVLSALWASRMIHKIKLHELINE